MNNKHGKRKIKSWAFNTNSEDYMVRPRINALLTNALKKPLTIVCAGAGYGKTRAVYDFVRESGIPAVWIQFTEYDNTGSRFWKSYTDAVAQVDKTDSEKLGELGFPDTEDKLNQYFNMKYYLLNHKQYIFVMDDIHIITDPAVSHFLERLILDNSLDISKILICRDLPRINIVGMQVRGDISNIYEEELNFTENELEEYLKRQGLAVNTQTLQEIYQDTGGWAFSINLVAQSMKKAPGYVCYVRNAMKQNIFALMEAEVWGTVSEKLKQFWVRLSLVKHLSADLVADLTDGDKSLLAEFKRQNAYVRFNGYIGIYLIHHLFLDFLRTKQNILTDEEIRETYKKTADWCARNDFKIDALDYYEKVGDYESIVSLLFELPVKLPHDIALYAIGIFERAPVETFDTVDLFAVMHLHTVICLGRWQEFSTLAEGYEKKFLTLPENNIMRNHTLVGIYRFGGSLRILMSTFDNNYDFDKYYLKMNDYLSKIDKNMAVKFENYQWGPWISMVNSSRQGAPQEFIEAIIRSENALLKYYNGVSIGGDFLSQGELLFYQSDIQAAEPFFRQGLNNGWKRGIYDSVHRALFYIMRIAVLQGNYTKIEQALNDIKELLDEKKYSLRFTTYDIALGWYYCVLRRPEMVPEWLKEKFAPYGHPSFIENFGNQIKARYCYLTKNYQPLLTYIDEMKRRESVLYGRIEMLAMEACVHYHMKNKAKAFAALREAYEEAIPNNILMPFVELGKDMRTLTDSALNASDCGIPKSWLEIVHLKSVSYAKYQLMVIANYEKLHDIEEIKPLTFPEREVLRYLYRGFSRTEISMNLNMAVSTVKMIINSIYEKLGARNIVDVIRIATQRNLL